MTNKKQSEKSDLIPLEKVRSSRMVFPNGIPLTMTNVRGYLEQLGIEPALEKIGDEGQKVLHVSADQAGELEKLFKAKHWRKFKAAGEK